MHTFFQCPNESALLNFYSDTDAEYVDHVGYVDGENWDILASQQAFVKTCK